MKDSNKQLSVGYQLLNEKTDFENPSDSGIFIV